MKPLEIGVMFWADAAPREKLRQIKAFGVNCGQIGVGGDTDLSPAAAQAWKEALAAEGFTLVTVFSAYSGESYADIPTVQKTVGFIPPATRAEREARTLAASDFAAALGVPSLGTHVGFIPHDRSHPDYAAMRELVRRVCDRCASHYQTFALETGQEPAAVLRQFLADVDRPNLRINFDPANMILYGTGDPIEALEVVKSHVVSVHCKDGDWPDKSKPGSLGVERALGKGAVGIPRFIAKLKEIGYQGALTIEREVHGDEQRRDIQAAVALLRSLV
ncbi:MAG TPA: sugar phosphate isomerase/epimerase family protein [Bryobacterales bacterium]|nr:sugar phosphate isomerase/epimerase family protein [Bryobacterales bacterium]